MSESIICRNIKVNNLDIKELRLASGKLHVFCGPSGSGKSSLAFDVLYSEADALGIARGVSRIFRKSERCGAVTGFPDAVIGIEQQLTHRNLVESVAWNIGLVHKDSLNLCPHCGGKGYVRGIDADRLIRDPESSPTQKAFSPDVKKQAGLDRNKWTRLCQLVPGTDPDMPWKYLPVAARQLILYGSPDPALKFSGIVPALEKIQNAAPGGTLAQELAFYISTPRCTVCGGSGSTASGTSGKATSEKVLGDHPWTPHDRLWLDRLELADLPVYAPLFHLSSSIARKLRLFGALCTLGPGEQGLVILDEPAAGMTSPEARQIGEILVALRDEGHTVIAVEHRAEVASLADVVTGFGRGSGIEGGKIIFQGKWDGYLAELETVRTGNSRQWSPPVGIERAAGAARAANSIRIVRPATENAVKARGARAASIAKAAKFSKAASKADITPEPVQIAGTAKRQSRRSQKQQWLEGRFSSWYGFENLAIRIPLNKLVCVTGPGGSGKTAYVDAAFAICDKTPIAWQGRTHLQERSGQDYVRRPYRVDAQPIGLSPASTPATYTKFWDRIREIYAALPESRKARLDKSCFSFNTGKGKCPHCSGRGYLTDDERHFFPCPVCDGGRFKECVLRPKFRGKNIAEINAMTFRQVQKFLQQAEDTKLIHGALGRLEQFFAVMLEYLVLGQPSNTLSGGENLRVKVVNLLSARVGERSLYIMDNPCRGIGDDAVRCLLKTLRSLTPRYSILVAENEPDFVCHADYIIELGEPKGSRLNILCCKENRH